MTSSAPASPVVPRLLVRLAAILVLAGLVAGPATGWGQPNAAGAPDHAGRTIVVGGDRYHPPYEFLDEDGRPAGYNVELTRAIAEVMGIDVRIELGTWSEMRRRLETGEIDVLQGISYSEERAATFDFAPPHAIVHQSIFARRGTPPVERLEELRGKEVIVQRGDIMHDFLVEQAVGATLITTDTHADALRALAAGQPDYALVANLPALYLSRELGLTNLEPVARPFSLRYGYAVKHGNADLLAQFSEGLAILKNTGRHQAIYDRWLGPLEQGDGIPWKRIGLVGAASALLLLVLGGIMVWNRMLKREVASRTEELRRQQQQLIQADKMTSLGILVSGVAHEINNPSGLLLLNLPVLRDAYEDARPILEAHYREHGDFPLGGLPYSRMRDEIPSMLDEMLDGTQRIKRIVGDLKDFARQGSSDLGERLDLNEVVSTAVRLVDNSIRKATDRFETRYAEALPAVQGNGQRIEQVVINLVLNACQALEGRDQGIRLTTRYLPDDGTVTLEVRDEGRGIDPEAINRLTDPFFTTRRECGGTGLGLSVSAGIVREHQGRLAFDSRPGEGTSVTLTLPAAPVPDDVPTTDTTWTQADR